METAERLERFISAEHAANQIIEALGLDTQDLGQVFRWMFNAITFEMNQSLAWETVARRIDIEDCRAQKPCDHAATINVVIDNGVCCVPPYFQKFNPILKKPANCCDNIPECPIQADAYTVYEQDLHFDVSSNANGHILELHYVRYRLDEDGMFFVDRVWLDAITAYVRWKHITKIRTMGSNRFSGNDEQYAKMEYGREAQKARGRHNKARTTKDEIDQTAAIWNDIYFMPLNQYMRQLQRFNYWGHHPSAWAGGAGWWGTPLNGLLT